VIGEVFAAAALHGGLSVLVTLLGARLAEKAEHAMVSWLIERLYVPMLRAGVLAVFVLLAYPGFFGLEEAPAISALVLGEEGRISRLVGVVFGLSLLLPLLPGVGNPALALPLQGAAGSALVFGWLASASGVHAPSYWPGTASVVAALALAYLAYRVSRWVAGALDVLGQRQWNVEDAGAVLSRALLLFLQVPAILVYGLSLGHQLPQG
jgi:hypothetical protein